MSEAIKTTADVVFWKMAIKSVVRILKQLPICFKIAIGS